MIKETKLSRRNLLKGAAATAAFAGGSTLGAPMIWAQNIKDVTLRQIGTGVSNLNEIAEKVKEDLGFNLTMTALDTDLTAYKRTLAVDCQGLKRPSPPTHLSA
jgi:putative spermidine/putrescine transport system substrate-binding protein